MKTRLHGRLFPLQVRLRSVLVFTVSLALGPFFLTAGELPVRTVVLYKHGIGYFERSGPLGPAESAHLEFKSEEMNDVLKSLTINDKGGSVTAVRYDSNIPLTQKLIEFPFLINPGQTLSAVLDQLKGARLELEFGQKLAGAIVSARVIPGDKDHAEHEQITLLLDSGELRNVDLSASSAIRFPDRQLQSQFRGYLAALTSSRSKEKRSLYIDSTDSKSREVRASYILPMPAWKSSYRLLFSDNAPQPTLEGWAIVDNTTGDDWTNVHMSLISGKPISFISDLYNPKYVPRATAELQEDRAVAPTVHEGAISTQAAPAAPRAMAKNGALQAGRVLGGVIGGVPPDKVDFQPMAGLRTAEMSTISAPGSATELADLFEYSIRAPVTVKRNESAMLPFLQQMIAARKLILYSDPSRPNPLTAAEITNTSGRTLDGGPITVYDGGAYAGEALVETIKNNDKRFISYGVDLGTRISTNEHSQNNDVRELHVHNGMLVTRSALVQKKVYSIRNVDARAKTLIIEHPLRQGFHLVDTLKPVETARDVYRFEVRIPASGSLEFPVTEENVYDSQTAVSSLTPEILLVYVRNKNLSDAARRQLQQISDLKTQIAALDAAKRQADTEVQSITRDEERVRQNIASLSSVTGQQQQVQDYARQLAEQETRIAKARDRQAANDAQRAQLQTQLDVFIGKLDF